jgi:triacylglycerol lipase
MQVRDVESEQAFACFDELVHTGRLIERLNDQLSTNIEWGTLGGNVFWNDLHECDGWRIQQHKWFGNCRIIDSENVRHAWGSKEYVFRRIQGQPINLLVNYLHVPQDGANSFAKYPTASAQRKGSVVLVHGWGCRSIAMEPAAKCLALFGYDAYCYDYQSSKYTIPELGARFLRDLNYLLSQLPADEELFILTHSMGGLITRKALELDAPNGVGTRIAQIVMLAPPNQGSLMADLAVCVGIGLVNTSINDMQYLGDSAVKDIGKAVCYTKPIGVIAGSHDLKVLPKASVHLPGLTEGKDYKLIVVEADHPALRTSFEALCQALAFFETGEFKN